ncbi:MAG: DUF4271 domain-containing protein [Flavobacteriales bacterium]|nr:DUF4271 domain-containing protein [Flavobacteriales bacterium]
MTTFIPLQAQPITPILRESPNLYEYWMVAVFLVVVGILAYVRAVYGKRLVRLFNSLSRIQILRQVMREELVFSHRASVLLFFNFVVVVALICYAILKYYDTDLFRVFGSELFIYLALAVALVYLFKIILSNILRVLYKDPGVIREYLFEVFLMNKALGIILLPVAAGMVFLNITKLDVLIPLFSGIFLLAVVFRLVQGLRLTFSYPIPGVYIILYLCTLEILPFAVLVLALQRV